MKYSFVTFFGELVLAMLTLGVVYGATITASVQVLSPSANIVMSSFTAPQNVIQDSSVTFTANLINVGSLSSGNIILNLSVSGSSNFLFTESAGSLAPAQSETVGITLANAAGTQGSDMASVSANYIMGDNIIRSNNQTTFYTVTSASGQIDLYGPSANVFLVISPVNGIVLNDTDTGAIISLAPATSNTEFGTITVTNATSNAIYSGINTPTGKAARGILLGISAQQMSLPINYTISIPYGCGASSPAPYMLSGGSWTSISHYSVNSLSCLVNFSLQGNNTVVGIFSGSGGVGNNNNRGGSSGGGSIGVGGGGTFKPSVLVLNSTCYEITNLTNPGFVNVAFTAGSFNIRANFISPTDAGVTVDNSTSYTLYPEQPESLSLSNDYNYTLLLTNISYVPAVHTIRADLCSYPLINSLSSVSTTFPQPSQPQQENFISAIPRLIINSIPLFSELVSGSESLSTITIKNAQNFAEAINLSVPALYADLVKLPYSNIVLNPNQSISLSVLYTAPKNFSEGVYIIPLNITTTANGQKSEQTEYLASSISQNTSDEPKIINEISLVNNTNGASGILEVTAPESINVTDLIVKTILPLSVARNVSDISAVGMNAKVIATSTGYEIDWFINTLSAGTTSYGYYTIRNLQGQYALTNVQNTFVQPAPVSASQIMRITSSDVPNLYVGSVGTIAISVLYTGSHYSPVSFTLSGAGGAYILNSSQTINATPNSDISAQFGVDPYSTGTLLLTLYISGDGYNTTYQIPAVVLNASALDMNTLSPRDYGILAVMLAAIVLAMAVWGLTMRSRQKYHKIGDNKDSMTVGGEKGERLSTIARQMDRTFGEEHASLPVKKHKGLFGFSIGKTLRRRASKEFSAPGKSRSDALRSIAQQENQIFENKPAWQESRNSRQPDSFSIHKNKSRADRHEAAKGRRASLDIFRRRKKKSIERYIRLHDLSKRIDEDKEE